MPRGVTAAPPAAPSRASRGRAGVHPAAAATIFPTCISAGTTAAPATPRAPATQPHIPPRLRRAPASSAVPWVARTAEAAAEALSGGCASGR